MHDNKSEIREKQEQVQRHLDRLQAQTKAEHESQRALWAALKTAAREGFVLGGRGRAALNTIKELIRSIEDSVDQVDDNDEQRQLLLAIFPEHRQVYFERSR